MHRVDSFPASITHKASHSCTETHGDVASITFEVLHDLLQASLEIFHRFWSVVVEEDPSLDFCMHLLNRTALWDVGGIRRLWNTSHLLVFEIMEDSNGIMG